MESFHGFQSVRTDHELGTAAFQPPKGSTAGKPSFRFMERKSNMSAKGSVVGADSVLISSCSAVAGLAWINGLLIHA